VFLNVTSPVPVLVVSPPVNGTPVIGTNVVFQFATASNQSYTVQANDDLATTNWVLYTNIVGNGSVSQFQAPVTAIQLFFRVSQP